MKVKRNLIKKKIVLFFCFFFFLIIGNLLMNQDPVHKKSNLILDNHQSLLLSLVLKIPFKESTPCILIDENNRRITNAYLLKKRALQDNFSTEPLEQYEVAIPKKNILKVLSYTKQISAIPPGHLMVNQKAKKKRSSYKIIF